MTSIFTVFFILMLSFTFSIGSVAKAQSGASKVRKSTTTVITKESESDVDDDEAPVPSEVKDTVKTVTFGSKSQSGTAGCKTEELSKPLIKDLKADCAAWVKDQKTELKARFQTSSCEESCTDCGMSLQRCNVVGTVHYIVK